MSKILVIGDTIVDKENYSIATGLSLESPTIKADFQETCFKLGGAANLVKHLEHFETEIDFFTSTSGIGIELLKNTRVNLINFSEPQLNIKSRYWVKKGDFSYKILQVNKTKILDCENKITSEFNRKVDISSYEKVIVSDYRLGLINQELVEFVSSYSAFCIGASQLSDKEPNYHWFSDFDLVVCNEEESKFTSGCRKVCITLGDRGCMLDNKIYPASKLRNVNTIGAGDAFLAAISSSNNPEIANDYVKKVLEKNFV